MEEVRLDARDMKPRPCTTCEEIINDAAGLKTDESGMTWGELALIICNSDDEVISDDQVDLGDPEGG